MRALCSRQLNSLSKWVSLKLLQVSKSIFTLILVLTPNVQAINLRNFPLVLFLSYSKESRVHIIMSLNEGKRRE